MKSQHAECGCGLLLGVDWDLCFDNRDNSPCIALPAAIIPVDSEGRQDSEGLQDNKSHQENEDRKGNQGQTYRGGLQVSKGRLDSEGQEGRQTLALSLEARPTPIRMGRLPKKFYPSASDLQLAQPPWPRTNFQRV